MSVDLQRAAAVSVVVLASDKVEENAATLRALIGQSDAVEVIVPCDAAMGAELLGLWDARPPEGLVVLAAPPGMPPAQRAALGCAAARGAYVGFVPAGLRFHPRHFALMHAAATSASVRGGVCLRAAPSEPRLSSWVVPPAGHEGVSPLLDGALVAESLLASTEALRACGGPAAGAGEAWLFDLALRVALEAGLVGTELPEPARPTLPPPPSPAVLDASVARWLDMPATAATVGPAGLAALREAIAAGWPRMREAVDAAIRRRLADVPLLIGAPPDAEPWREGLRARLPGAGLRDMERAGDALALLATLAGDPAGPTYVMLAGNEPPDIDRLVAMCLRMEAEALDACLPVIDDGLFHPPATDGLLRGTLFRRERLVEVFSAARPQDEHRFWAVFAARATIDAAGAAAPRRPEPRRPAPLLQMVSPAALLEALAIPPLPIPAVPRPSVPAAPRRSIAAALRRWKLRLRLLAHRALGNLLARLPTPASRAALRRRLARNWSRSWNRLAAAWTDSSVRAHAVRGLGRLRESWPPPFARKKPDPVAQLVDAQWYARRLPGGLPEGVSASDHYRRIGWREGLDPNPFFPTDWYLDRNPDVRALGMCPLEHYVVGGAAEMLGGRTALPFFDPVWYARRYGTRPRPAHAPMVNLVLHGARRVRLPHPLFTHEAVRRHLEKVEAPRRGEEMRRLWELRAALAREPQSYAPAELTLLSTVLLWNLPPRAVPVVRLVGEPGAEPEAPLWRIGAEEEVLRLSAGEGEGREVLFPGAERHRDVVRLLAAIGARFDALAIERLG